MHDRDARYQTGRRSSPQYFDANADLVAYPTSHFTMEELADIYNQTRVDYIVPMPMNAKRLLEYVTAYDIDMDASLVVQSREGQVLGISMLGLRDARAWITRLGVLPVKRRRGTGQFIMDHHLHMARGAGALQVQLEVIKGNDPAHRLFLKNDFLQTRELLVIRRPPGAPNDDCCPTDGHFAALSSEEIHAVLKKRADTAAWTEENATFYNLESVRGLSMMLKSGEVGHLIYQQSPFQLSHLVLCRTARRDLDLASGLLLRLHQDNPLVDTKVENVALDDPLWPVYQHLGYVEVFRRIEMVHFIENTQPESNYH